MENEELKRVLCEECAYCEKRKRKEFQEEGWQLAIAIFDSLTALAIQFPVPLILISVYLLKHHVLDEFCGCD